MSTPWIFTQLTGPKKVLKLDGRSAPHGRPRVSPVVSDGFELREKEVFYQGNDVPTRLIFGTRNDDWEISGRFDDRFIGPQGAGEKVLEIKRFIRDGAQLAIQWDAVLSATGLMKKIIAARESATQIAYTITLRIDSDDQLSNLAREPPQAFSPSEQADQIKALLSNMVTLPVPRNGKISPTVLDILDQVASNVGTCLGLFVDAANQISNLEDATNRSLSRIVSSISLLRTAVVRMIVTLQTVQQDAVNLKATAAAPFQHAFFLDESVESQISFYDARAQAMLNAAVALALLSDTDLRAEIAARGDASAGATAQAGDTWESLSLRFYGGTSGADRLRQANGARYGEQPTPGQRLKIPSR